MRWLWSPQAVLLLSALLTAAPALGQDQGAGSAIDALALSGSLRAGYWTSDRKLDDHVNFTPLSLWLKATPDLGNGFSARLEGWGADQDLPRSTAPKAELREGFVGWRGDALQLAVGRRLVTWGRADQVNPTNVVASRDYTLLFSDDNDEYRGNLMATAAYGIGDYTTTVLWVPEFRPNVYPVFAPSGVTVTRESGRVDVAQAGIRLDHVGGGFDWALSYFDGIDRDPDFRITSITPAGATINELYHRMRMLGGDFATNLGDYGLRGEIAYGMPYQRSAADAFDRHSFVTAVIGVDRNVIEHLNVNVQYVLQHVTGYANPQLIGDPNARAVAVQGALLSNQLVQTQHGMTLRIGYTALNDLLFVELEAAGFATDQSGVVRPKVSYAITDTLKVIAGADVFFGGTDSYFGHFRRNRTGYVELRQGF